VTTTGQKQYNPILKCKKTYLVVANNKSFSVSCIPLPIHKHLESSVGKAVKGWDRLDNGKFRNCVDDRWSLVLCILSRPMLPMYNAWRWRFPSLFNHKYVWQSIFAMPKYCSREISNTALCIRVSVNRSQRKAFTLWKELQLLQRIFVRKINYMASCNPKHYVTVFS